MSPVHSLGQFNTSLRISNRSLERVNRTRLLGIHLSEHLYWEEHVHNLSNSYYSVLGILRKNGRKNGRTGAKTVKKKKKNIGHLDVSLLSQSLNVAVNDSKVEQVTEAKVLGVTFDHTLSWEGHVETLCKKLNSRITLLRRIQPYLTQVGSLHYYNACIHSQLVYCFSLGYLLSNTSPLPPLGSKTCCQNNTSSRLFYSIRLVIF